MNRRSLVNPPNLISLCRLPLAVVFVGLPHAGARVAVLLVAMLTDLLDGWVALRTNAVTRAGALIDPIADRLFLLAVVLSSIGAGNIAAAALVAPPAMAAAGRLGIPPVLMILMVGHGAVGGSLSPFSPTGLVANGLLARMGLPGHDDVPVTRGAQ